MAGGYSQPEQRGLRARTASGRRTTDFGTEDKVSGFMIYAGERRRGPRDVLSYACPGDEKRGGPGAAAQHRSRGRQSGYLAWLAARPAERQRGVRMQRSRVTTSLFGWCPDRASAEETRNTTEQGVHALSSRQ